MADAKKKSEAPESQDSKDSNETDLQAEWDQRRYNATGGHTGTSRLIGGPTQADLNPAYAPPPDDEAAPDSVKRAAGTDNDKDDESK